MVGGASRIVQDVPPFTVTAGSPAVVRGINVVGLQRRGFDESDCRILKNAYKKLFFNKQSNLSEATAALAATELGKDSNVAQLIEFIQTSERGVLR